MKYQLIDCDTIIKKITARDKLFNGAYSIDPYQNCEYGCLYCDSSFENTIFIKINAGNILKHELKQIKKGMVVIGSVNDPYQKAEEKYEITKQLLNVICKNNFPCHILTKSTMILRDIDILSKMKCRVTISITSLNENISRIFERDAPSPKKRMQMITSLMDHGIQTGLALIPVLPFIVESELEEIVKTTKYANAKYLLFKYLELKGDQKKAFEQVLHNHFPHLISQYRELFKEDFKPNKKYISKLTNKMFQLCSKYNISQKLTID
jgi:DNA repair photolyase